jgi:hypothetical protein
MDQSRTDPLKDSFPLFLCVIFEHLDLAAPTKRQLEIARYLQGGPKRLWIAAFRGVGKTWVTVAFVLWLLYCNPQLNILVVSASKAHADNFSIFCKRLLDEVPELAFLRPSGDQRNSNIAFDVGPAEADINPSVRSAGITGQITGSRADVIVADDIEVPNNSATQDQREKLLRRVGEFDDIIKPAETSRIIFLGTPQSDQTMYNSLPRKGFDVRFWPGRFPKSLSPYNGRLAPTIVQELKADPGLPKACGGRGAPTDTRFNDAELWDKEISKGRSDFVLQYMLDTSLSDSDKYPLRLSDMIVLDCDVEKAPVDLTWASDKVLVLEDVPNVGLQGDRIHKPMMVSREAIDWTPYQGKVMSIDPAGRGGDEVGWAVVAYHYGRLYLLDAGGLKGGYQDDNLIHPGPEGPGVEGQQAGHRAQLRRRHVREAPASPPDPHLSGDGGGDRAFEHPEGSQDRRHPRACAQPAPPDREQGPLPEGPRLGRALLGGDPEPLQAVLPAHPHHPG